ncbi:lipid kinase [Mesorhizobium sp. M7A.F.Ca.US.001.04.1.1]|uniref:lipid kinase n=2 Tax=Mesorhizobium TaxID=68287 RepID=UPI000FCB622C|nr:MULTISPECIES: lipid kinase [unclassified Mesorhizobium]RUY25011.1 lipid kinase [Mesorhizobium sp. M7A.F.Ca.US.001.04.2.1]RUY38716.1 lipid kinase [Mesorhizobium sp. M7A.F.Ca.US.001.04.1.1]
MSKLAKRRALLLLNPKARRGQELIAPIVERLERGRLSVTVEKFEALPEIARDIVRLRQTADLVVVCGGDGSLSAAAMAVVESRLPMGIIPMGTANDLARTLDIPMDLLQAADVIVRGRLRQIDIGTVNGNAFFNVASIGLSTELAKGLDPTLKKRFGRLGYALAAVKVLTRATRFHAKIIEKGASTDVETYQIAVGNGRHYGGGNVVEETAEIDDGHLDLYSLEMTNLWKLALMLRSFRSGRHGAWREVRTARCVEFDIETEKPMPVNTDGEIVTSTPAHFKVHPKAISVFAPPPVGIRDRTEGERP